MTEQDWELFNTAVVPFYGLDTSFCYDEETARAYLEAYQRFWNQGDSNAEAE